ncbi:MAG: LysR family transcriptional regulator [Bacteriovoracaceae bacterium]|nr:LysR family transcriptional regulator [Bacteriovoracaceae bacterium]
MGISLNPLQIEYEYFLVLCETLNISRASEVLDMGQGSLSKALKKLEDRLKNKLFVREGRGLRLTEFGILIQKQIIELKENWESGIEETQATLDNISGLFRVGAHQSIAIDWYPEVIPELIERHRTLEFDLVFKNSSLVTREVIDHTLDIGVVANPLRHPNLVIKKLKREYVSLWTKNTKDHEKVIYYNPEMIQIAKVLKEFKDYKHVPITSYELLAVFGLKSKGIFLLPNSVAERFKYLNKMGKNLSHVDICLIYHVDRPRTRAFKKILSSF